MMQFDDNFYNLVNENKQITERQSEITDMLREKYLTPLIENKDIEGLRSFIAQVGNTYARFCARDALTELTTD